MGNITNKPTTGINNSRGILIVKRVNQQSAIYITQVFIETLNNANRAFLRVSDETWSDWKEISTDIPAFYKDYANLASLANGLANTGMFKYMSITEGIDFNDTDAWCWCYLGGQVTGDSTNKPSEVIGSIESSLVTFGVGNYKMQLFFVRDTIYYRHRVTAGWNTWKKITLTSI